jgi:hypothetical protein
MGIIDISRSADYDNLQRAFRMQAGQEGKPMTTIEAAA